MAVVLNMRQFEGLLARLEAAEESSYSESVKGEPTEDYLVYRARRMRRVSASGRRP